MSSPMGNPIVKHHGDMWTAQWNLRIKIKCKKYYFGTHCYIEYTFWGIPRIVVATRGKRVRRDITIPFLMRLCNHMTVILSERSRGKRMIKFREHTTQSWIKISRRRCQKLIDAVQRMTNSNQKLDISAIDVPALKPVVELATSLGSEAMMKYWGD